MGCYNTCIVAATADKVWATLRDFHDMSWAEPVITSVAVIGELGSRMCPYSCGNSILT